MILELTIAALIFTVTAVLSWKDLRYGLYLFIFTLPLDNRTLFTLGISRLMPFRVVLLAVLLVSLIHWRKKFWEWLKPKALLEDSVALVLLALWFVRAISLVNTQSLPNSLGLLAFYSAVVALYFVLRSVFSIHGGDLIHRLLKLYVIIGVLTGIVSVVQFVCFKFFGVVLPAVWPTEYQPVRVGSTFWDINHYAAYLATVIPAAAALAMRAWGKKDKIISWVMAAFALVVLGMTLSRSGWAAFGLAMLVMWALLWAKKLISEAKLLTYLGVGLVFFSILGSLLLDLPILERIQTFSNIYNNDAIKAHALILGGGFEIFTKYPILGCGYGGFNEHFRETSIAERFFEKDPVEYAHIPAHSIWMEVLAETGVVGFALYTMLIILFLQTITQAIRKIEDDYSALLNIACFSSIVGLLVSGIFYSYNLEFFWFFIFLSVFLARESASS